MQLPALPVLRLRGALAAVTCSLALSLAGCGTSGTAGTPVTPACTPTVAPVTAPATPVATGTLTGVAMSVKVLAGVQPITGASVQLYAAGMTGLGSAPTALASAVTTASTGAASIPAGYTCPATNSQLYVVSRGGQAGSAAANSGIVLMTALGACNQQTAGEAVVVNEVTTVAAAYALSQFMAAGGVVGATSTNVTGIANAFATAINLANPALGTSPGSTFPTNGVSPAPRIDSVANLLNACTSGTAATGCSQLYTLTANSPGVAPTNTLDAAFNLARNPGTSIATRYTQSLVSTAFSPVLAAAPADWTMTITYSGGGMNSPSGLGIDSAGNVRVANYFNVASAFSPIGAPLYPSGVTGLGLDNSYGLAVDANDNAWIPNEQSPYAVNSSFGSVSVLNKAGASQAGSNGYSAGGLNYPIAVAIDVNTTSWVVDYGNSHLTLLSNTGTPLSGASGYTTPLFAFPVAVAIDGNHYGWIANQSSNTVTKVAPDGSSFTNYTCCTGASAVAVDQQNNVWVANFYGDSVSQINSCGTVVSTGYTASGSLNHPQSVAIDGAGTVWVANFRQTYITELAGSTTSSPGAALSPSGGFGADAGLLEAYALAIAPSGDIWVSNFGSNTLTEFVGLARPVRTPLLSTPQLP
ncbi:hypothetical protein SAMN05421770_105165 [Granulicella rosea]|uniref:Streptogramin lyase n=1 Tax=Granulicella rosea TaxID=474952 RepID=A0A239KT16_9BACT|nr:hypothetical protein [Granulicella rosea]SNT20872.1 hypothetical protein SAMN05421770_105165 [Granulicella rosea]